MARILLHYLDFVLQQAQSVGMGLQKGQHQWYNGFGSDISKANGCVSNSIRGDLSSNPFHEMAAGTVLTVARFVVS